VGLVSHKSFQTVKLSIALCLAALVSMGPEAAATPLGPSEDPIALNVVIAPLGDSDPSARRRAFDAVASLGPAALPAVTEELARLRRKPSTPTSTLLKKSRTDDPVEGLLARSGDVAATALTWIGLARALSHMATTPAVRVLVAMAADLNGALRPELSRQVRALGDRAVPALLEARLNPSRDVRTFATSMLETLEKRAASDTVQTKSSAVLADVLRAYGLLRDLDALAIVLSFANADRTPVRLAARDAVASYGPDATGKLRESLVSLTGKQAPETWSAVELRKALFDAYDEVRLHEVVALLDDGLAKQREGKLDEAAAMFDRVLARQPLLDRRREMVVGYVGYAESLESQDLVAALSIYRKALRLDPQGDRAKGIEASIAYLEGRALEDRGLVDPEPYRRAGAMGYGRAEDAVARFEQRTRERTTLMERLAVAAGVLTLLISAGVLLRRKAAE
jgi:tetratricopeptide (TPR) repeat protein